MASIDKLALAVRLLRALQVMGQSQGSLTSQARDCAPVVEALGYYDLADHLRQVADPTYLDRPLGDVCPHFNGAAFYCRLDAGHRGGHEGYWANPDCGKLWTGRFLAHPGLRR